MNMVLGTNFQLKLKIMIFRYFRAKIEQHHYILLSLDYSEYQIWL